MHDSKASSARSWVLWAGAEVLLARLCSKELEERTQDGTLGVGGQGLGLMGKGQEGQTSGVVSSVQAVLGPGQEGVAWQSASPPLPQPLFKSQEDPSPWDDRG